jgi:hypothetical protein
MGGECLHCGVLMLSFNIILSVFGVIARDKIYLRCTGILLGGISFKRNNLMHEILDLLILSYSILT